MFKMCFVKGMEIGYTVLGAVAVILIGAIALLCVLCILAAIIQYVQRQCNQEN